jgi:D-serine deaminase-like pyridoxal phosphate-dependent protein
MLGTIPVGTSSRCTASSVTRVGTRAPSNIALATARENAAAAYLTAHGLECAPGKPRADTAGNPDPESLVTVKISYDQ